MLGERLRPLGERDSRRRFLSTICHKIEKIIKYRIQTKLFKLLTRINYDERTESKAAHQKLQKATTSEARRSSYEFFRLNFYFCDVSTMVAVAGTMRLRQRYLQLAYLFATGTIICKIAGFAGLRPGGL